MITILKKWHRCSEMIENLFNEKVELVIKI